ncbi:MAG: thermonuclease family protein [Bacteroidales bacterium]|nr:thermonuclease family protein [Bacteroidales bacterium]
MATCHLKWLVEGRKVGLEMSKVDAYGRWVAVVWSDGRDVGGEMLKEGLAWYREEYGQNPAYSRLQSDAKMAGRGLWSDGDAIEPWKWRKMSKWERDAWR